MVFTVHRMTSIFNYDGSFDIQVLFKTDIEALNRLSCSPTITSVGTLISFKESITQASVCNAVASEPSGRSSFFALSITELFH